MRAPYPPRLSDRELRALHRSLRRRLDLCESGALPPLHPDVRLARAIRVKCAAAYWERRRRRDAAREPGDRPR